MFGQHRHRIGRQHLVVADRRRDRLRPRRRDAGLRIVGAVAAGLEGIDADDLLARQARGERDARIGALEFEIARRLIRHEAELGLRVAEEIGDHRDRRRLARFRSGRRIGIDRARRAGIDRRLLQHVVLEQDGFVAAALGVADAALVAHRVPVGRGGGLVGPARRFIGRELGLVVAGHSDGGAGRQPAGAGRQRQRERRQQNGGDGAAQHKWDPKRFVCCSTLRLLTGVSRAKGPLRRDHSPRALGNSAHRKKITRRRSGAFQSWGRFSQKWIVSSQRRSSSSERLRSGVSGWSYLRARPSPPVARPCKPAVPAPS